MHWVYLLKSQKNQKLYIGETSDIKKRLAQHNQGSSFSTRLYIPWKLIYCEGYLHKADAVKREKNLKYFGKAYGQLKRRIAHSLND